MFLDFMIDVFKEREEQDAIVWRDQIYSYRWLAQRLDHYGEFIRSEEIEPGTVTVLEADFSPDSVTLFLALVEHGCVLVPFTSAIKGKKSELMQIAQAEVSFALDEEDNLHVARLSDRAKHELYDELRELGHPGLVLFSSGSTGASKGAVHDLVHILEKFRVRRHSRRTVTFLLFDHIGGVNTMFYTLSNGGCIVSVRDRSPDGVLKAIQDHRVEMLPTSPTFINLILISEAYKRYDLSTLRTVTYGTEPMPESVLRRFHQALPHVQLLQTYGLSEIGILRSKSKSSDSLWVKVGGEGFETRVVDGLLHIKARSAMLGYLNAPSPFTEDGWLNTGDSVEVDGEYLKILGRTSEMINVGGEKVYPAEVESIIQEMDNVAEVTVYGEKNRIVGNIVCARVTVLKEDEPRLFTLRLKKHCRDRLENFKVPVKVIIVKESQHSERFKKVRSI